MADTPRLAIHRPPCVVAIPARNEVGRIAACLRALDASSDGTQRLKNDAFGVLVLLNGCTDATREQALAVLRTWRRPWRIVDCSLPAHEDHAGGARAAALRAAMAWVGSGEEASVLTTDADTLVSTTWVKQNLTALAQADVVAGEIDVLDDDLRMLPSHLIERQRRERLYGVLLDEIDACCDPVPHDPWPNHRTCSGASLAFRSRVLAALPSLPAPSCGEDRALVAALAAQGACVRHDPQIRVATSGRLQGRAAGGMADTLRQRLACENAACDPLLEPVENLVLRASLRAQARPFFHTDTLPHVLATRIGLVVRRTSASPSATFEHAWQWIETHAALLTPRSLTPTELPEQIARARAWLIQASTEREIAA